MSFRRMKMMLKFIVDKQIPLREKLWLVLPAIYIISPIDLIPFPILGFSLVDDLVVFIFTIYMLNAKVDKYYSNVNDYLKGKTKNNFKNKNVVEVNDYEIKDDDNSTE